MRAQRGVDDNADIPHILQDLKEEQLITRKVSCPRSFRFSSFRFSSIEGGLRDSDYASMLRHFVDMTHPDCGPASVASVASQVLHLAIANFKSKSSRSIK
jgi:hypothetical protein